MLLLYSTALAPPIARQPVSLQHDDEKKMAKQIRQAIIQRQEVPLYKQCGSFTHLPQYLRLSLQSAKVFEEGLWYFEEDGVGH